MRDPVMLDWRVPENEWDRFVDHVESEFGAVEGYLSREAELAMRQYYDGDGYDTLEETVDRLVRAAGRTPGDVADEKKSGSKTTDLSDQSTTRVTVRVDEQIKEQFRVVADQSDHDTFGIAFARAIQAYRRGGRAARLEDKLDRVVDDAEKILSELDSDSDTTKKERNIAKIKARLDEQFTESELESEIHDVAGQGPRASDPTLREYKTVILEQMDVDPHPITERNPETDDRVWLPEQDAREYAPENVPRVCYIGPDLLDREERVRRIVLTTGRRAAKRSSGTVSVPLSQIRDEILDGELSKTKVRDLLDEVALVRGYQLNTHGETAVVVSLQNVTDQDLLKTIVEYRDADVESLFASATDATMDEFTTSSPQTPDVLSDDDKKALDAATDGGGPARQDGDRDD